jgi:hypothetical protein
LVKAGRDFRLSRCSSDIDVRPTASRWKPACWWRELALLVVTLARLRRLAHDWRTIVDRRTGASFLKWILSGSRSYAERSTRCRPRAPIRFGTRFKNTSSAIREYSDLDKPLEVIPARYSAIKNHLRQLHHAPLGLTAKTLANHKSNAKAGLLWLTNERSVLDHRDPRVTEEHYNRASSMSAAQTYAAITGTFREGG